MRRLHLTWSLLFLIIMLVACVPAAPGDRSATTPSNDAGAPAGDQTLILAAGDSLGPGNPHNYSTNMALLDLIYEPLVRYGSDGSIRPALAESWEISADGLIWTFKLRAGVTFHDGAPFDAAAVKWNLERWVGVEDHSWLPSTTRIAAIETPDDATVVLTMREAYYPTVQDLTLIRPVRFLSPNAVDAQGEFAQPIGTGPWKVESLDEARAVLVRNDAYWGEQPKLDKVVIEVILDAQTRVAALQSGEVHIIGGEYLGTIAPESLPTLRENSEITVLTGSGVTAFFLTMQVAQPPFDDLRVRQALNHAIDRQGISTAIFGGLAEPATGLMPASIPYVTRPGADLYTYDPQRAQSLLAEAGWTPSADGMVAKDGQPLQIDLVVDQSRLPETASIAAAIQAQLRAVGVDLELRLYEYSGWLDAYYAKDFDLLMDFTWGPPYDPHTVLNGSFRASPDESAVVSYSNPELDALIDTVLATTDESERQALYDQIWSQLDENAAVIPLAYPQRLYAHRNEVQGFQLGGTEYDLANAVQNVVIGGR
jgi:nickel ABC transporter nickel/metallophore binding protein